MTTSQTEKSGLARMLSDITMPVPAPPVRAAQWNRQVMKWIAFVRPAVPAQPLLAQYRIAAIAIVPAFLLMHVLRIPREKATIHRPFGCAGVDQMMLSGRVSSSLM